MKRCSFIAFLLHHIGGLLLIRHWRGHGIHSPFAYGFVRDVYMKRHQWRECNGMHIYDSLVTIEGLSRYDAALIQRLSIYINASSCCCAIKEAVVQTTKDLVLYRAQDDLTSLQTSVNGCGSRVIVVISPNKSYKRYKTCKELIDKHCGLSIECQNMVFLFYDKGLNDEYIKL